MLELISTALITSIISALVGATVGALVSQAKTVKQHSDEERQEAADTRELIKQNTIMTCRMAIYDEHFDVDEKLEAYKVYSANGGNHRTKTYMDELVGGDVDEYIARHGN